MTAQKFAISNSRKLLPDWLPRNQLDGAKNVYKPQSYLDNTKINPFFIHVQRGNQYWIIDLTIIFALLKLERNAQTVLLYSWYWFLFSLFTFTYWKESLMCVKKVLASSVERPQKLSYSLGISACIDRFRILAATAFKILFKKIYYYTWIRTMDWFCLTVEIVFGLWKNREGFVVDIWYIFNTLCVNLIYIIYLSFDFSFTFHFLISAKIVILLSFASAPFLIWMLHALLKNTFHDKPHQQMKREERCYQIFLFSVAISANKSRYMLMLYSVSGRRLRHCCRIQCLYRSMRLERTDWSSTWCCNEKKLKIPIQFGCINQIFMQLK